jgi:hypothetical protein
MFENIDELIEVNLKLLYASKSHFMMRINFKDEFGFNLKNSKAFAEILEQIDLVTVEKMQGFRCDLTHFGRQVYESGGWIKHKKAIQTFAQFNDSATIDSQVKKIERSFLKKIMIVSIIVIVLCFFVTLLTVEIFKVP